MANIDVPAMGRGDGVGLVSPSTAAAGAVGTVSGVPPAPVWKAITRSIDPAQTLQDACLSGPSPRSTCLPSDEGGEHLHGPLALRDRTAVQDYAVAMPRLRARKRRGIDVGCCVAYC